MARSIFPATVRFQSFERRRRGLCERNIKLLHRSQRFAQFAAQLGCRLAQRVQHLLLGRRRHLLLRQRVSALAIHRLNPSTYSLPRAANRSGNVGFAARPLAKLAGHLGREFRAGRTGHQLQSLRRLRSSESTFRNGDCRRETLSAVFSVSSNTASPVLLAKSARTMVSFSVSVLGLTRTIVKPARHEQGDGQEREPQSFQSFATRAAGASCDRRARACRRTVTRSRCPASAVASPFACRLHADSAGCDLSPEPC